MSILGLSLELLQEIACWIPARSDQKQLRLVCRSLKDTVAPSFFSCVLLDLYSSRLELGLSHLEELAMGDSPWSRFARTLTIKNLSLPLDLDQPKKNDEDNEPKLAEVRLEKCLNKALKSLRNVRTVRWTFMAEHYYSEHSKWIPGVVADSIVTLPVLDDLRLTSDEPSFGRNFDCYFDRLTGLRTLTLASSDPVDLHFICVALSHAVHSSPLSSLRLTTEHHGTSSPLNGIADLFPSLPQPLALTELRLTGCNLRLDHGTLPHLRSLRSLWLSYSSGKIWETLRIECIHLSEIHTDYVQQALLEYMSSYSGLERLTISGADETNQGDEDDGDEGDGDEDDSDKEHLEPLAEEFFTTALPRHKGSLVALSCRGVWEGKWSFGAHNVDLLSQLHRLKSLRMNVNVVSAGYAPPVTVNRGSGRGRRELFEIERDSADRNLVHRFLDLINELHIMDAAILPAAPLRYRKSSCGNPIIRHKEIVIGAIDAAVREFKTSASGISRALSAVVLAGHSFYKMDYGADKYRAFESLNLSWPYSYEGLLEEHE
ncbi:hypothetical protein MVEN_01586300 [Mycena venus]|uniref:F-box domain-containing protein n=1 Tax=Mycena venus TaxID=2733690 RepID=A0A8H6XSL8_9AGAR|nr:hypothetical protein MVEN_01586300 [Mycena venus]